MKHLRRQALPALVSILAGTSLVQAQSIQPPTQAEAQAALNPAPASFTPAQLDQMLAPIALYPDQLLTELLMAATFPQQVVDAGKWFQDGSNAALKGDDLVAALQALPWDPSVKSLIAFPQIIAMMNDHLDWAEALGIAFANQEVQTMARVQFLRDRAMEAGQLKTTPQLAVSREDSDIIIEPVDKAMIYVPVYNPAVVYGTWPDSDDPPVYIPPPPGFFNGEIGAGIAYSIGFGVAAPLWGWGHPDWHRHEVIVDPQRFTRITAAPLNTNNHIEIHDNTWHRTEAVTVVPGAARPQPPRGETGHPPGTVTSTAIRVPASPGGAGAHAEQPATARPSGSGHPGGPPSPGEPAHPAEGGPHPSGPPSPAEAAPHPGEPPRPAEAAPHPGESRLPAEAAPHPGEPPHPAEAAPHPGEPPHPAEAAPHPAEPPHPAEAAPHSGEPPRPAGAAPHPGEPSHPAEAAPHPAEPPHPGPPPQAAHPGPPPAPHPAPAEAHPSGPPHPAGPAQKPPPKPGEEKKEPDQH